MRKRIKSKKIKTTQNTRANKDAGDFSFLKPDFTKETNDTSLYKIIATIIVVAIIFTSAGLLTYTNNPVKQWLDSSNKITSNKLAPPTPPLTTDSRGAISDTNQPPTKPISKTTSITETAKIIIEPETNINQPTTTTSTVTKTPIKTDTKTDTDPLNNFLETVAQKIETLNNTNESKNLTNNNNPNKIIQTNPPKNSQIELPTNINSSVITDIKIDKILDLANNKSKPASLVGQIANQLSNLTQGNKTNPQKTTIQVNGTTPNTNDSAEEVEPILVTLKNIFISLVNFIFKNAAKFLNFIDSIFKSV